MAHRYYGLSRGDNMQVAVTEQASSPSKDLEVNIDLAAGLSRAEALQLLEQIEDYISKGQWPPA